MTALITGQILVLPLIGIIFVVETGSVILQVAYFRLTGGKRLFRMSPLHHHFELGGWDEEKITIRFWIVGILAALLGVTLFLATSAGSAAVSRVTMPRQTIDPDALTMAAIRDGRLRDEPVTVLGLARSGIALARFLADAGARVTVYDGRPAGELGEAIAALEGRDVRAGPRAGRGSGERLGGRGPRDDVAVDQPRLPDDRAAAPGGAGGAGRGARRVATPRRRPWCRSPTCSCGCARPRRSG